MGQGPATPFKKTGLRIGAPKQGAWVRSLERELDSTCHNEDPAMPLRPGQPNKYS